MTTPKASGRRSSRPVLLPTLRGCVAKLERAKAHRDAIERNIISTFSDKANRPRLGVKYEPETVENVAYVTTMPDHSKFLEHTAVITGDAINNLRSVLDHLAFQLAVISTDGRIQNERRVQFPICDNPDDFQRKTERYLGEVAASQRTQIESVQPYHGLQGLPDTQWSGAYVHPLAVLRDLSDQDKHRLLIPTLLIPSSFGGSSNAAAFITITTLLSKEPLVRNFPGEPLYLGAVVLRSSAKFGRVKDQVDMDDYVTPSVCLAEGGTLIDTLDRLASAVTYVLSTFEPLFK